MTAQEAGLKSAKDRQIVEYASKHNLFLVTEDQKPAQIAEMMGAKCVFISNLMIAKRLLTKKSNCLAFKHGCIAGTCSKVSRSVASNYPRGWTHKQNKHVYQYRASLNE